MKKNYDVYYGSESNPYGVKEEKCVYDILHKDYDSNGKVTDHMHMKIYVVRRLKEWMCPVFKVEFFNKKEELINKAYIRLDAPQYVRSVKFETNDILASDELTDRQVITLSEVLMKKDCIDGKSNSFYYGLVDYSIKMNPGNSKIFHHVIPHYENLSRG